MSQVRTFYMEISFIIISFSKSAQLLRYICCSTVSNDTVWDNIIIISRQTLVIQCIAINIIMIQDLQKGVLYMHPI